MRSLRFTTILLALIVAPLALADRAPRVGDIREEQRKIGQAYLGDATFQIEQALLRIGAGNPQLGQQSGLWALEQLAYAKRRLERHAPRIEETVNIFGGRIAERARVDLRESYRAVRQQYVNTENRLDALALRLQQLGFPLLNRTLTTFRQSTGDQAVNVVRQALQEAGLTARGDIHGDGDDPVTDSTARPGTSIPVGPNANGGTLGSDGVVTISGVRIPGTYDPATNTIQSPTFGRVDLNSAQTNANGVTFIQTDRGVLMIPPGILIPGAKLNPDGTITFADGSVASINNISVGPDGRITVRTQDGQNITLGPDGRPTGAVGGQTGPNINNHNGPVPSNIRLVDANGNPVTVDGDAPPFENGRRSFVRRVYLGVPGGLLQRETRVNQQLVGGDNNAWRVDEQLGESRSWSLTVTLSDSRQASGRMTATVRAADLGGATGISITSLVVENDMGQRAEAQPVGSTGAYSVTFTQSGEYTAIAEGTTDWGSKFRIEASLPVGIQ